MVKKTTKKDNTTKKQRAAIYWIVGGLTPLIASPFVYNIVVHKLLVDCPVDFFDGTCTIGSSLTATETAFTVACIWAGVAFVIFVIGLYKYSKID